MERVVPLPREAVNGLRPFIPDLPDLSVEELKLSLNKERVIKLSFNESPYGPFFSALEKMRQALEGVSLYPDVCATSLRNKLAEINRLSQEQVVLSNGADEMILLLAQTYLNPGDEVIIPVPTFGQYAAASKLMDANIINVSLKDFGIDLNRIKERVSPHTKLIFICNPNNPTGKFLSGVELEAFLKDLPPNVLVILDEAYFEYVTDSSYLSGVELISHYPNVFVVRTFSKIYGLAALRVGYGLGSRSVIADINRVRPPFNVNLIGQVGALASLNDQEQLEKIRQMNRSERDFLTQQLKLMGLEPVVSETNFILVNLKDDCRKVFTQLLEHGIIIRPADIFGLPNFARITIGEHRENLQLIQALSQIISS
jgi:histidinol-phosphate aminotransferase